MRRWRPLASVLADGPSVAALVAAVAVADVAFAVLVSRLEDPHPFGPALFAVAAVCCCWHLLRPLSKPAAAVSGAATQLACGVRAVIRCQQLVASSGLGVADAATTTLLVAMWLAMAASTWVMWTTIVMPATGVRRRQQRQRG